MRSPAWVRSLRARLADVDGILEEREPWPFAIGVKALLGRRRWALGGVLLLVGYAIPLLVAASAARATGATIEDGWQFAFHTFWAMLALAALTLASPLIGAGLLSLTPPDDFFGVPVVQFWGLYVSLLVTTLGWTCIAGGKGRSLRWGLLGLWLLVLRESPRERSRS